MDSARLDRLARSPARCTTRRGAVRLLGGGLVGALLATGRGRPAAALAPRRAYILSGGPDQTDTIFVDDDLTVLRNGNVVFKENDEGSSTVLPISFRARRGDVLRIRARNAQSCIELSPLYLHRVSDGNVRKLHRGIPFDCSSAASRVGVFFDKRYTI